MKRYILVFIFVLCISCAFAALPPSPVYMGVGVSNVTTPDGEAPVRKGESYIGDLRLVDVDREMTAVTKLKDDNTGARTDFPQYARFH